MALAIQFTVSALGAGVRLPDLSGKLVDPFASPHTKAIVFVFVSTECPISNRYAPEVRRLAEQFSKQGVSFWLVYPLRDETREAIEEHLKAYDYPPHALRDPRHELVELSGARVTPETAVFVPSTDGPKLVYRGRIDDRYIDFGKWRREPTSRDLEGALKAILSGAEPETKITNAIGCFIPNPK